MDIRLAQKNDKSKIIKYDCHIHYNKVGECIWNNLVYVLIDDSIKNGGQNHRVKDPVVGVLRYSMFWQTIPFLDFIYIDEAYRKKGYGSALIKKWEKSMKEMRYKYVMTSTQTDETAYIFYEKLGYQKIGSFLPPEQDVEEWIYLKMIGSEE